MPDIAWLLQLTILLVGHEIGLPVGSVFCLGQAKQTGDGGLSSVLLIVLGFHTRRNLFVRRNPHWRLGVIEHCYRKIPAGKRCCPGNATHGRARRQGAALFGRPAGKLPSARARR